MPGPVYRSLAAEAAGIWKDGKLLDKDGVGTLLVRRGAEWFVGRSATPAWRQRGDLVFRGPSSEAFCRIAAGSSPTVYRGNTSTPLYQLRGDALLRANGRDVVVRGPGLTTEELVMAALAFEPPA